MYLRYLNSLTTDVTLGTGDQSLNDRNEGLVGLSLFLCIDLISMRLAKGLHEAAPGKCTLQGSNAVPVRIYFPVC